MAATRSMRFLATLAFLSAPACSVMSLAASQSDTTYPYLLDDDGLYWDASIQVAPGIEITPAEA